jgi:hypothetical protein
VDTKQFGCKSTGKKGTSDRSGISGDSLPGDTAATNLVSRDEHVTSRHAGKVSCIQCAATFLYFQDKSNKAFTSM